MPHRLGLRTLVVVDFVSAVPESYRRGSRLVQTPLDLVVALEEPHDRVVLIGAFARERCFARFVREVCPSVELIVVSERNESVAPMTAVFV